MTSNLLPGESLFESGCMSCSKGVGQVVSRAKSASNIGSSGEWDRVVVAGVDAGIPSGGWDAFAGTHNRLSSAPGQLSGF